MSQFIRNTDDFVSESSGGIDFDRAVKLPSGGSTCDIYRTRHHRREVFVKRLKEEYRTSPLYLDAMEKEFEVGVGFHHPGLPEYRELHRDYIVMDFIDGSTLAAMMRKGDPWLTRGRNVRAMLRELVEAVDYLHRHNVAHCDIKPDNIMITARGKHLVLIDFDKSYTDALNDTSGDPARYGLTADDAGSAALDFRGIAGVAERLAFPGRKRFVRACLGPQPSCEELLEILRRRPRRGLAATAAVLAAAAAICAYLYYMSPEKEVAAPAAQERPLIEDAHAPAARAEHASANPEYQPTESDEPASPVTQKELHDEAERMAAALDVRIGPAFDELLAGLDRLAAIKNDSTATGRQMLDSVRAHSDLADEYIAEAFEILGEIFPGLSEREACRVMAKSRAYTGYTRRATPELREYGLELERRMKAAGENL